MEQKRINKKNQNKEVKQKQLWVRKKKMLTATVIPRNTSSETRRWHWSEDRTIGLTEDENWVHRFQKKQKWLRDWHYEQEEEIWNVNHEEHILTSSSL